MSISLKQLNYLRLFVDAIHYININANKTEDIGAVLYQLVIAGEIVAKQDSLPSKLTDEVRKLLSITVCDQLQKIRNDFLVHSSLVSNSESEEMLLNAIKIDKRDFTYLEMGVVELILRESINLFCNKLKEITSLDNNRFSKMKTLINELYMLTDLIKHANSTLDMNNDETYKGNIEKINSLCKEIFLELLTEHNKDIGEKARTTNIDRLRKTDEFINKQSILNSTQTELLNKKPLFQCADIKEPMNSLFSCLKKLETQKTQKERYSTPEALLDKESKIDALLIEVSDKLKSIMKILTISSKNVHLRYDARWRIIVICALFEERDVNFSSEFKHLKNSAIHQFDKIDPEKEIEQINIELPSLPKKIIVEKEQEIISLEDGANQSVIGRIKLHS